MLGSDLTARARLVARALKYRYRQDVREVRCVRAMLPLGGIALDIGAHKGAYTYWMRRAVGPSGRVIAFEPQVELARTLARLFAATPNVTVLNVGVSSREGPSRLAIPGSGPSPGARVDAGSPTAGGRSVPILVTTVDRCVATNRLATVDFVKCDVEGHELDVFEGAVETLHEHRPTLLFECEERHLPRGGVSSVFAFLARHGYEGFFFDARGTHPVAAFDPSVHQGAGALPYINNFLFTPRQRPSRAG